MTDDERKKLAVDAFLDPGALRDPSNPHSQKLERMFAADPVPDLGKVRERILAGRFDPKPQKTIRPNWRSSYLALAAVVLLFFTGVIMLNRFAGKEAGNLESAHRTPHMQPVSYAKSVNVFYRQAATLATTLANKKLTLTAKDLSASFAFTPNDEVKTLEISTNGITVTVIGTKFIVHSDERGSVVLVREGRVKVSAGKDEHILSANELFSTGGAAGTQAVTRVASTMIFDNFTNPTLETRKELEREMTGPSIDANAGRQRITLTLRSGTVIKGLLIEEKANVVHVMVPAMGNKALVIEKGEILERK